MGLEICVEHGEGTVDDGHKVLGERAVDGGSDEFLVVVEGVPVCRERGRVSVAQFVTEGRAGESLTDFTDEELEHALVLDLSAPVASLEAVLLRNSV